MLVCMALVRKKLMMICSRVTYFTDSEIIKYYPKYVRLKWQVFENQNLRKKLRQMHYAKKSCFMIYAGSYDCYENQNTYKKNDCLTTFCKFCSLLVLSTEGYQIIYYFSRLNRLVSCHFIMSSKYIRKTSWEQD